MASISGLPPHIAGVGAPVMSAMGGAMAGMAGLHQSMQGAIPSPLAGLNPLAAATTATQGQITLQQLQQQQQQHLQQHPPQHPSPQLQHLQGLQPSQSPQLLLGGQDFYKKADEKG